MTQLYQTALPAAQANTSDEGVRAQIQQSGLLQEGGTATEKIASENIDLVIEGEIELGATFAEKLATEIESIGESDYSGIPLYTIGASNGGRNAGYYEVEQVDVSPAHPVTGESYAYTVGLKSSETRQDKWTAIQTSSEDVQTGLATGSNSLIGLPATATKARWFSESSGKENATVSSTVSAEFGDVDLYDPTSTSITNPILLYELAYSDTGDVDVRVYDDKGVSKTYSVSSGGTTVEASQWPHAYHTSYEFEGDPVVDNGLLRVRFDEPNSVVEAYEWDTTLYTAADSTTDWGSGTNTTLSLTNTNTSDGTAVRADTDDASTDTGRSATYNPSGTVDMSAADHIRFWYYTDNAGGTHSLEVTDGSGTTTSVGFSSDVVADSGGFISVPLSVVSADLTDVDSLTWLFSGPSGEDKYIIVDSVRYGTGWSELTVNHGDYELIDADFERIGPSDVRVFTEWYDTVDDRLEQALLSVQRGLDRAIARYPPNTTQTSGLESVIDAFVGDYDTDNKPERGLEARSEVK